MPATTEAIDRPELGRYVRRVLDRWPLQRALLAGARVDDLAGAPPQRERGPEFVVILVAEQFDGTPWLERVHRASALWDAYAMGDRAQLHCYTAAELARRAEHQPVLRRALEHGLDLLAPQG